MNNEIKEILDRIETASEIFDCLLKPEECTELLDYITNLQHQISLMGEDIRESKEINGELQQDMKNYVDIVLYQRKTIDNLQQENERLKEWKEDLLKENIELENIRKEVIEFIKEKISSTKGVINDYMFHKEDNKHLIELLNEDIEMYKNELNILQNGSDK